jgi:hypothetical protein
MSSTYPVVEKIEGSKGGIRCVCKSKTTARCMNHEKDLDYIPQLPSSVRTLDFVNNYLPH